MDYITACDSIFFVTLFHCTGKVHTTGKIDNRTNVTSIYSIETRHLHSCLQRVTGEECISREENV